MDTSKTFEIFLSWQTTLLCLGLFGIVFGIRKIIEGSFARVKSSKWWNEVAVPVLPLLVGLLFCLFAKKFPYPAAIQVTSVRILYGVGCGLVSGWIYARAKAFLKPTTPEDPSPPTPTP